MKVFLVGLVVLVVMATALRYEERPRFFCGRALAEARILYCFETEVTEQMKRIERTNLRPLRRLDVWSWYALRLAASSKRTPGLVDECCLKPCYVSQLLSYC